MITDKSTLMLKLEDAVSCSLFVCEDDEQRRMVQETIVEFFCAIGLRDLEYREILNNCLGVDADVDSALRELISEFDSE